VRGKTETESKDEWRGKAGRGDVGNEVEDGKIRRDDGRDGGMWGEVQLFHGQQQDYQMGKGVAV
jgi:hypothetical protein